VGFLLVSANMLSPAMGAMVVGSTPFDQGTCTASWLVNHLAGEKTKKASQSSLKEKRAQKRQKNEESFIKPRKGWGRAGDRARRYAQDMSDHPTYPAKTGIGGVMVWVAVVIAIVLVAGFVWRILQ
jgi:hypothetical protein